MPTPTGITSQWKRKIIAATMTDAVITDAPRVAMMIMANDLPILGIWHVAAKIETGYGGR